MYLTRTSNTYNFIYYNFYYIHCTASPNQPFLLHSHEAFWLQMLLCCMKLHQKSHQSPQDVQLGPKHDTFTKKQKWKNLVRKYFFNILQIKFESYTVQDSFLTLNKVVLIKFTGIKFCITDSHIPQLGDLKPKTNKDSKVRTNNYTKQWFI